MSRRYRNHMIYWENINNCTWYNQFILPILCDLVKITVRDRFWNSVFSAIHTNLYLFEVCIKDDLVQVLANYVLFGIYLVVLSEICNRNTILKLLFCVIECECCTFMRNFPYRQDFICT